MPAEIEPDVRSRDLAGPGLVLLCSDGLWNYAPKPGDIAAVLRAASDETNAVEVARLLVELRPGARRAGQRVRRGVRARLSRGAGPDPDLQPPPRTAPARLPLR